MAKSAADKYNFEPPQFRDLLTMLDRCAQNVVKGIVNCVRSGTKPDGSQQKQNAASTISRKGHSHPVTQWKGRFEKQSTYAILKLDQESLVVTVKNPVNSEIGAYLHEKGYEFFDITAEASMRNDEFMDLYVQERMIAAFQDKT